MKEKKIGQILQGMSNHFLKIDIDEKINADLYSGSAGLAICHTWFYKYTSDEAHLTGVYNTVSHSLNNLESLKGKSSLSGYSGVLWVLAYLINIQLLTYDQASEYIHQLKKLIIKSIHKDIDNQNFDLMHGLIGKLIALVNLYECSPREQSDLPKIIEENIIELTKMAILDKTSSGSFWKSVLYSGDLINTGMAHGLASIVWFLAKMSEQNFLSSPTKEKCSSYVVKAVEWLICGKKNYLHPFFCFPCNITLLNSQKTPQYSLAWCHGDLGIASAFLKAGTILQDQQLSNEGLAIAKSIAKLTLDNSTIMQDESFADSTLCHGTFGAFFIFYQLYLQTGEKSLKDAYSYWLKVSLNSINNEEKLFGLMTGNKQPNQNIIWQQNIGLLNGLAGNALVLLTYIMQEKGIKLPYPWFNIFL